MNRLGNGKRASLPGRGGSGWGVISAGARRWRFSPTPALPQGGGSPAGARNREAGFTLTELMVVIFILGLLATVVLINVMPSRDRAMTEKARADIGALEQALELYRLDLNNYPTTEQGLEALVEPPPGLRQPDRYRAGGYIRGLPDDPWGNPYQYVAPGARGPFDLYSLGADGAPGGEGQDADIGGRS